MPVPTKKQKDLLELAKRGGRDSELMLLDKINELEDKMQILENSLTEFEGIAKLEKQLNSAGEIMKENKAMETLVEKTATKLAIKLAMLGKGDKGDDGHTPTKNELENLIIPLIPEPKNGIDGRDGADGPPGKDGAEGQPGRDGKNGIDAPVLSPEEIKNQLESLEGDNKLNKTAIKGYEEDIKVLSDRISNMGSGRIMSGPNANAVQSADLTSQCNGVTKTFTVPRHRVALMLIGTQAPILYRPTTDFTTANTTLTLTAAVLAPDTLQSLVFLYIK